MTNQTNTLDNELLGYGPAIGNRQDGLYWIAEKDDSGIRQIFLLQIKKSLNILNSG